MRAAVPTSIVTGLALAALTAGCGAKHPKGTAPIFTGSEKPYRLTATLNGAQEVPAPKGAKGASGSFSGTIKPFSDSGTLEWRLGYSGLSSRAIAARIFFGAPGKTGFRAIDLCSPCKPGARGFVGANSAILQPLLGRPAYVSIETKRNPRGEIRGRIHVVKPTGG
jgi:hypothetical protein